jgi:hypothetical protein
MLIKKASLMTNSRAIIELHAVENLSRTMELSAGVRDAILSMAGSDESVTTAVAPVGTAVATAPKTMYVPLLFECFKTTNNYLDMAFMEECTLLLEFETSANMFIKPTAWTVGEIKIDFDNTQLLAYYVAMSDSDLRKYENANFSVDEPLSMLSRSTYPETTTTVAGINATETSAIINFNCPNLIEKSIITLTKNTASKKLGDFLAVSKIEYYIGGRLVYSSSGQEELLENAVFFSAGLGPVRWSNSALTQNIYVHYWNLLGSQSDRCSGFVSGKNSSNFSVKVFFVPDETETYYIDCVHSVAQVISISGTSGKCAVSLSV